MLATKLNPNRFDVIPCAVDRAGPLEAEFRAAGVNYRVLELRRRSVLTGPLFVNDMRRMVKTLSDTLWELSIDIVHTHLTRSTLLGVLAARRSDNVRVCATVHNVIFHNKRGKMSPRRWLMGAGIRMTFPRADRLIAVSEEVAGAIQSYAGIASDRITTIVNGIDSDRFAFAESKQALRRKLSLPADQPIAVSVGRLTQQKGYPHLLAALALVPRAERPLTLIVGDGSDRAALEAKSAALKVDTHVRFLGNRHDVPELLAASDIFVLSSLWEGLPLALLEAMAASLPAVVTAVGGNPKVVEDNVSGILVPPADERALAEALRSLIRQPSWRQQLGQSAHDRFQRDYSSRRFIEAHETLYETMLDESAESLQIQRSRSSRVAGS
jgi:glycosyltransferase involved in cell wall biosynthesis